MKVYLVTSYNMNAFAFGGGIIARVFKNKDDAIEFHDAVINTYCDVFNNAIRNDTVRIDEKNYFAMSTRVTDRSNKLNLVVTITDDELW